MTLQTHRVASLQGELRPPSDKSLTHRAYMFASIADGLCRVCTPLTGEDCQSTLRALQALGLTVDGEKLTPREWHAPASALDCGNSGTTARLLSGLLAGQPFSTKLTGDASLSRRPMRRIIEPLTLMGARFEGDKLPLTIQGTDLKGITYDSPVASAQVKSAVLLAGLHAQGTTRFTEPSLSRDHTERMFRAMNIRLEREGDELVLEGGQRPTAFEFAVPADISSAAFWLVAAALVPESRIVLKDVGVNPSRTGILDVLTQVGVPVEPGDLRDELGEPVADLVVETPRTLKPFQISGDLVPRLIDEIPILAVLATQCEGVSVIRNAEELRVKESDRIETMANALTRMGANIETFADGMAVYGPTPLHGQSFHVEGDHRVAMALAIAGLIAEGTTEISGAETIATSYPQFHEHLRGLAIV